MKPIIIFFSIAGERFRHVVGHHCTERLTRDALGKATWVRHEDAAVRSGLLYNLALVSIFKNAEADGGRSRRVGGFWPDHITMTDDGIEIEVSFDAG